MQGLQILVMIWWLILILFLNPAPCFCYFHSSVIGRLYNVLFGFNEKSNAQLLFLWKVLKGATLKEMRTGCCERLFLPSETSWEDRVVGLPRWKKGAGSCCRCFQHAPCRYRCWALNTVHVHGIQI